MSAHRRDTPDPDPTELSDLLAEYQTLTDPRDRPLDLCVNIESDGSVVIYHPDFVGSHGDEWIKAYATDDSVPAVDRK